VSPLPALAGHALRVFVVDDEPTNRDVLAQHLGSRGFTVELFSGGHAVLERFRDATSPEPDLMLLDVMMPGCTGYDVLEALPYFRPGENSPEMAYMHRRSKRLGGSLPQRRMRAAPIAIPPLETFRTQMNGTGDREISTTMAFVRMLASLLRDKEIGRSQEARQKAFMSNYFAPAKASTSTMAMEAATSAPAVFYTVEQVWAQQTDRIFRRAVQNLHVQIIEVTGEHARTHTREMKRVKRWRNCQRRTSIGLDRSAECASS
jgi:hypothetical protein